MPFLTITEAGVPIQGPSATLIYDDWYPALRTGRLRKGKLAKAMLLGIPLVLGRRGSAASDGGTGGVALAQLVPRPCDFVIVPMNLGAPGLGVPGDGSSSLG